MHNSVDDRAFRGLRTKESRRRRKWYLAAAEQGHTNAEANLGYAYEQGRGIARDFSEAAKWYRRAAGRVLAPGVFSRPARPASSNPDIRAELRQFRAEVDRDGRDREPIRYGLALE